MSDLSLLFKRAEITASHQHTFSYQVSAVGVETFVSGIASAARIAGVSCLPSDDVIVAHFASN